MPDKFLIEPPNIDRCTTRKLHKSVDNCDIVMVNQYNGIPSMKCEKKEVSVVNVVHECHTVVERVKNRDYMQAMT